jgi:hypothetical protein
VEKLASNVTPSSPRSLFDVTGTLRNGVASRLPFFTTRSFPPCSATKTRPSGATAIAVGLAKAVAIVTSSRCGGVPPAAGVVADAGADCADTFPAASKAATAYE